MNKKKGNLKRYFQTTLAIRIIYNINKETLAFREMEIIYNNLYKNNQGLFIKRK